MNCPYSLWLYANSARVCPAVFVLLIFCMSVCILLIFVVHWRLTTCDMKTHSSRGLFQIIITSTVTLSHFMVISGDHLLSRLPGFLAWCHNIQTYGFNLNLSQHTVTLCSSLRQIAESIKLSTRRLVKFITRDYSVCFNQPEVPQQLQKNLSYKFGITYSCLVETLDCRRRR